MKYQWKYEQLCDYTYNILPQQQIKPFLLEWLLPEWEADRDEFPDQIWTIEWLNALPKMNFTLQKLEITSIVPRDDLMNYSSEDYDFQSELLARIEDRKDSIQRGVSIEPIVVNSRGNELMDGYSRYFALLELWQKEIYAYVGSN